MFYSPLSTGITVPPMIISGSRDVMIGERRKDPVVITVRNAIERFHWENAGL